MTSIDGDPQTIKTRMQEALARALETEDPDTMDKYYHFIVDQGNKLRVEHGLPEQIDQHPSSIVLKTPSEQLKLAGVGHSDAMGGVVCARAKVVQECLSCPSKRSSASVRVHKLTLYELCFVSSDKAHLYLQEILKLMQKDKRLKNLQRLIILPPLLLRSQWEPTPSFSFIKLHLQGNQVYETGSDGGGINFLLVVCPNGPIIPILDDSLKNGDYQNFLHYLYSYEGTTTASNLKNTLILND